MDFAWRGPHRLVVALKFGDSSKRLLKSMRSFCQKTSMPMRVVHVVEKDAPLEHYQSNYLGGYETARWVLEMRERSIVDAEKQLMDMLGSGSPESKTETVIMHSYEVSDALVSAAHEASLLAIGVGEHAYPIIPKSFSVVLSLLATAALPVLVIRDGGEFDFRRPCRLLIADDLSPACEHAVGIGLGFALATGAEAVVHAHFLDPRLRKFAQHKDKADEIPASDSLLSRIERAITQTLKSRSGRYLEALEAAGCTYTTRVSAGRVADELHEQAQDFKPDIIVLGRTPSTRFLAIGAGRLALNTVLTTSPAVLVVPST